MKPSFRTAPPCSPAARSACLLVVMLVAALATTAAAHAADGDLDMTFHGDGTFMYTLGVAGVAGIDVNADDAIYVAYTKKLSGTNRDLGLVRFKDTGPVDSCGAVDPNLGGSSADYAYTMTSRPATEFAVQFLYVAGSAAGPAGDPHDRSTITAFGDLSSCAPIAGFGGNGSESHAELDQLPAATTHVAALLWVPDSPAGLRVLNAISNSTIVSFDAVGAITGTSLGFIGGADFDDGDDTLFVPKALLRQNDGKLIVVGTSTSADGDRDVVVARFNKNLFIDTSFGQQGFARFSYEVVVDSGDDIANGAALLPDGRIVVAGYLDRTDGERFAAVAELTANGQYYTSFGNFGRYVFHLNDPDWGSDILNAAAVDDAGNIIVAGSTDDGLASADIDFAVARLKPTGANPLDTTFGNGGIATVRFEVVGTLFDQATSVLVDHAGRIVVGGLHVTSQGAVYPAVARLKSGLLRDSFESGNALAWSASN